MASMRAVATDRWSIFARAGTLCSKWLQPSGAMPWHAEEQRPVGNSADLRARLDLQRWHDRYRKRHDHFGSSEDVVAEGATDSPTRGAPQSGVTVQPLAQIRSSYP